MSKIKLNYGEAILSAFTYLLENYEEVFVIGQGLWSPWYVGNTMTNLDKKFGASRVIDTPVSESACTSAAIGASLCNMKPIVVHPRMDFMMYAMDSIVNQAAKWSHMTGGQSNPGLTIRGIINRGGEQGAQHSQALHATFSHIPGLRVVMPSSVEDARNMLIDSVLCPDPVLFIDDRWLYDQEENIGPIKEQKLSLQGPECIKSGKDLTIVSSSYSTLLAKKAEKLLDKKNISAELIDLRVLSPLDSKLIIKSVKKTGRLLVLDGGWKTFGVSGEIVASVCESISPFKLKKPPIRLALPDSPAPTSRFLEKKYYFDENDIVECSIKLLQ